MSYQKTIVSDNGIKFTFAQYREYCKSHAFEPLRFLPDYHQLKGKAEKFVHTLKQLLRITKGEIGMEELIGRFLTTYIHSSINGKSHAELLMGRAVRTINQGRPLKKRSNFKQVTFKVDDPVLASHFRSPQTWITSTVAIRRGRVLYEIQVNSEIWI